ncbi:hypothetical protein [Nostoc sp.]|uniref:hypothetical protein n=1 Tax=Nostoc sp. TaxID=1180 RepID=UPI002FFA78BA
MTIFKGNKAKIDWDNGYSEVYSFEQIQRYGYKKLESPRIMSLTIENIKNLTLQHLSR